jgi:flagellar basal-body rod protein FlgC
MGSGLFGMLDISASGMSAERFRMEVVANNIANAQTTRDVDGQPYRRKQVVFEAQLQDALSLNGGLLSDPQMGGVRVAGVAPDMSDFHEILQPNHPHADADGVLKMPNVKLPNEMVDLVTATRIYEANLKAIQSFKQMIEQSLQILRS